MADQKISVPWLFKAVATFIAMGPVYAIVFGYSIILSHILFIVVIFIGTCISFTISYNLWQGKKWARELVIFFGGLATINQAISLGISSLAKPFSPLALAIQFAVFIIFFLVIRYFWQTRKMVYGVQQATSTMPANSNNAPGFVVTQEKHKRGFLSYAPLILLILNIPFLIMDFSALSGSSDAGLGGIVVILHAFAVISAIPFIIWSLVSGSKVARIVSLLNAGLFLGPFILFEILLFVVAPLSSYTYNKKGNDVAEYVSTNPTFQVEEISGSWIKPVSDEYPIVFLESHEENNIYKADQRIYEYYLKDYFITQGHRLTVELKPNRYSEGPKYDINDFLLNSDNALEQGLSEKLAIPFLKRYKSVPVVLFDEEKNMINDDWLNTQISNDKRQTKEFTGFLEQDNTPNDRMLRYIKTPSGDVKNLLWEGEVERCFIEKIPTPCIDFSGKTVTIETLPIGDMELIVKAHLPKDIARPVTLKPITTTSTVASQSTPKEVVIIEPPKQIETGPITLNKNNYQDVFEEALKDLHVRVQNTNSTPYVYKNVCGPEIYTIGDSVAKLGFEGVSFTCLVSPDGSTWSAGLFVANDDKYGLCTNNSGDQIWLGKDAWGIAKGCTLNP